jgi:hypothetical protein
MELDARPFAQPARRDLGDGGALMRRDFEARTQRDVVAALPIEDLADIGEGDASEFHQDAVARDLGATPRGGAAEMDRFGDVRQLPEVDGDVFRAVRRIAGADRRLAAAAGDEIFLDETLLPDYARVRAFAPAARGYKSSGRRPVCLARRASIRGPSSSPSWKAKT